MFPKSDEERRETRPRPAAPERSGLPGVRDSEVFEALRDRAAAAGSAPKVFLACLGARRDFGGREMFTTNAAGRRRHRPPRPARAGRRRRSSRRRPQAGAKMVILCSSAKVYAAQAVAGGAGTEGRRHRDASSSPDARPRAASEDVDTVIDGEVFDGMDVVAFLDRHPGPDWSGASEPARSRASTGIELGAAAPPADSAAPVRGAAGGLAVVLRGLADPGAHPGAAALRRVAPTRASTS